jgi:hypothetical protein
MFRTSTLKALFLALFAILGWSSIAQAQTCGFTATATASGGVYDPFNPTGKTATITLSLVRKDSPTNNGFKTAVVGFYLQGQTAAANGIHIIPTTVAVNGSFAFLAGQDIFYGTDEPNKPFMGPPTDTTVPIGTNAYLKIAFTGNDAASNPATVTFDVTLPANLNINTSTTLPLDAVLRCTTTGGGPQTDQSGTVPNAISFPITVLSALQASFAGTALDFGEVGDVTNALASTRNTGSNNYIRVQSSGAYQVALTSANAYRLKHPTGSLAVATQRINYSLKFLGTTRSNTATTTISQNCARAGIGAGNEDRLYLMATLAEGGVGKDPSLSGTYSDILTVTITPQDIGTTYPQDCNAFTVP